MSAASVRSSAGPWRILFRRLRKNRVATLGGIVLLVLYAACCLAGFISPYHYADGDRNSSGAGPMLFGGYAHVETEVPSRVGPPGSTTTLIDREWTWFEGGIHFHDSEGNFTLRPHVHPLVELEYRDEYDERCYARAADDRSISLPVEFFVEGEPHEGLSLLGVFPIETRYHLFGVTTPVERGSSARVYLLGSDRAGRDIFTRLLYGGQISLSVGLLGVGISMSLGMLLGGLSGYFGGAIDFVGQRVVEVILAVPGLYLIIVVGGVLRDLKNPDGSPLSSVQVYLLIVLVLAFVYWASISRVIRGMVLSLKENEYVLAARAVGVSPLVIVVRHILPNTFSFAIVTATLTIPYYILGEVSLSFLGLGIQDPESSWGLMLSDAQDQAVLVGYPWVIAPGVFIFIAVMAYNFLGDGLRDAADPRAVLVRRRKTDDDE